MTGAEGADCAASPPPAHTDPAAHAASSSPAAPPHQALARLSRAAISWAAGAALLLSAAAAGHAAAQILSTLFPEGVPGFDTAPGVTVLSRARPAYDPLGITAGAFRMWPRLETSIGYDDNVLAGAHKRGSLAVVSRPSLLIGSGWSRDAFGAYFAASDTRYPDIAGQSRTDATASVGGTIDIGRDKLTLAAAHLAQHQDRSQLDALPSDRPVALQVDDARLSYGWNIGRWMLTPSFEASRWHFGDTTILGQPVSQAYRDRTVLQGGVTLRYNWQPLRNLLLVTRAIGQRYTTPAPGQLSNDSTGYQMLLGLDYDDNSVWRYRLLLGGEVRAFAAHPSRAAFIAEAEVTWSPDGMTTLRATASRSIEDAAQEGVAGFTYTAARLTIDRELLRNVLLSASLGGQHAAFLQGGGTQTGYSTGLGVTWLVNRSVRLSATYDLNGVRGAHAGPVGQSGDYTRQFGLLSLRLGL